MRTEQNYGWLDRFRVVVALLAITNHTSALASINADADFFLTRVLARIVVPFFLMVTGQFVAANFLTRSPKNGPRLIKYLRKTSLYYALCILLYLPIGIYAGHYKDMTVGTALRMLIFDGTFYHLWYFPACILGILLIYLMSRVLNLWAMTAISSVLYLIGLLGDSYYGLIQKVPALNAVYKFGFQFFSYTRNGLFMAPIFLVLGMWMSVRIKSPEDNSDKTGFLYCFVDLMLSFIVMVAEAFTLHHFDLQKHDSMYLALVPTMFFLYQCLLYLPKKPSKSCRTLSTWIYILHPAFIVVIRAIAKVLNQTALLVDNSVIHYLAVTVLSVAASFFAIFVTENLLPQLRLHKSSQPDAAETYLEGQEEIQEEILDTEPPAPSVRKQAELRAAEWQQDMPITHRQISSNHEQEELRAAEWQQDTPIARRQAPPDCEQDELATEKIQTSNSRKPEPSRLNTEKRHGLRAWIELDATALAHNVAFLRSRLPKHCRLMPAVKAEAYGHGGVIISKLLNQLHVDAFCVACLSEGIALRKAGIKGEILILGFTAPEDFPLLCRFQLTQAVIDYEYAKLLEKSGETLHVHIAVDTGMHRLGIRCENIEEILTVYQMKHLMIDGIFTHLSASDSLHPQDKTFTENQIRAFYQVVDILEGQGYQCQGLHLLASYGILNLLQEAKQPDNPTQVPGGQARLSALAADYVRPGIALYGVLSTKADHSTWPVPLQPVLSLKTKIASVRTLYAGEAAGYGLAYTARQDMQIATLSIGYADGLPRELSHGKGSVLIHGCRVPIIGRICMDQTIVDASNVPDIKAGDIAVIIGKSGQEEITVEQIAQQCDTITNELLSRLGHRLERIVLQK